MSIDKQSNGVPQVDLHRRTTKVNLATASGVILFLIIAAAVIIWYAQHHG